MKYCKLIKLITTSLAGVAFITGCGSGGSTTAGVGTGGTGSVALVISGSVADGYLVNAPVFLDRNGNYQLDAGEPFSATDVNGAYTLDVVTTDLGRYPLVAMAIKGVTIDRDTNQAVANSYVLSMPKENVTGTGNNFISPLSAMVRELMETGEYTSLQHASLALSSRLGLSAVTDLTGDYLLANNTALHAAAQNMAALMGDQMGLVLGTNGQGITVDVNRYRGMMGLMFNNMSPGWCQYPQSGMSNFSNTMTTMMSGIPVTPVGQPYWNMSSAYLNMMGVMNTGGGPMVGP